MSFEFDRRFERYCKEVSNELENHIEYDGKSSGVYDYSPEDIKIRTREAKHYNSYEDFTKA